MNISDTINYLKIERNKHTEAHQVHYDVAILALEEKQGREKVPLTNLDTFLQLPKEEIINRLANGICEFCKKVDGLPCCKTPCL
jgi:hypothetical protein